MASLLGLSSTADAAPQQRAGIQAHLLWGDVDAAEMNRQLDWAQESGADMLRVDLGWASLQQSSRDRWEQWYVDRIDRLVAGANARGIQLLFTFMNTPCWASTAPEPLKQGCAGQWWNRGVTAYPPSDPQDYGRALAWLANRYKGRVAAWEVWNEPNHPDFWKSSDQAGDYAKLLKAAYPAAKAADPATTIVGGSLSQSDWAFTQKLYDDGIKGSLDAFAIHPYTDDVSPLDPRATIDPRYSFVRGVPKVHDVMLAHGDDSPVWLTESGFSTSTTRGSQQWINGVSEATQAQFLAEQFQQVRQWPWVGANIWFNLKDAGSDQTDKYSNCGLRRVDGTAKPAFATFREAAAQLHAAAPADDTGAAPGGGTPAAGGEAPSGGTAPADAQAPGGSTPPSAGAAPAAGQAAPPSASGAGTAADGTVAAVSSGAAPAPSVSHARRAAERASRAAARARARARRATAQARRSRRAAAEHRLSPARARAAIRRAQLARRGARIAVRHLQVARVRAARASAAAARVA